VISSAVKWSLPQVQPPLWRRTPNDVAVVARRTVNQTRDTGCMEEKFKGNSERPLSSLRFHRANFLSISGASALFVCRIRLHDQCKPAQNTKYLQHGSYQTKLSERFCLVLECSQTMAPIALPIIRELVLLLTRLSDCGTALNKVILAISGHT